MSKPRAPLSTDKPVKSYPAAIPSGVAKAMDTQFDLAVSAYLSSVQYGEGEVYLTGVIFGDDRKRFADGTTIFTSIIMGSEEQQGYLIIHTLNSSYVICDWAGSEAKQNLCFIH
ncbi:hypothetical protein D3C77_501040 [compost metagenome]